MPVSFGAPFPFFGHASRPQTRVQAQPQPPKKRSRVSIPEKSESEKRKDFLNKIAAEKEKTKTKPVETEAESTSGVGIQCPICLDSLSEVSSSFIYLLFICSLTLMLTIQCLACSFFFQLKKNNKRLKSTTCGHILCNECLEATLRSAGNAKSMVCPTCRTKLTKAKIHDLFL